MLQRTLYKLFWKNLTNILSEIYNSVINKITRWGTIKNGKCKEILNVYSIPSFIYRENL